LSFSAALGTTNDFKKCLPAGISGKFRYYFDFLQKTSQLGQYFFAFLKISFAKK